MAIKSTYLHFRLLEKKKSFGDEFSKREEAKFFNMAYAGGVDPCSESCELELM